MLREREYEILADHSVLTAEMTVVPIRPPFLSIIHRPSSKN